MDYKIKINERFDINASKTYNYIRKEWGFKVADEFYKKIQTKIELLVTQPYAGIPSKQEKIYVLFG